MTKAELESQQKVMAQRPEDLRPLFKGLLSDDPDTRKRAKDKLLTSLYKNPKIGRVVKRNFSQINFGDSNEFFNDSLTETFLKIDNIIQAFCRRNQITVEKLNNFSEQEFRKLWIGYFNRCHYNKARDLSRQWQRKNQIGGQRIVSIEEPKNDADGQEYKTIGEEILDHRNINNLDNFNLKDLSQETIDKLPIVGSSAKAIDRLRNCARNVDCFEILILKCQGYKDQQIGDKIGVNQSTVNRNWNNRCLKCINKILAENNIE